MLLHTELRTDNPWVKRGIAAALVFALLTMTGAAIETWRLGE